jgi:competence protein ComFC
LYKYNEFAKEFVAKWKFRGDYELIYSFKNRLKKLNIKNIDYIVPIPLSEKRGYERGFNQSEAICNLINSKKIKLIIQKKEIEKQSKKTKQERVVRENPFFIPNTDIIKEKNILLVDDIYTTGTTLHQVSKLLYENGAREIKSFTIFR